MAKKKKISYKKVLDTPLSSSPEELADQLNQNPGLWVRLHHNVVSYILPDVME